MSKKFGALLTVLVVLLTAAVTYLTFEVTLLKDQYQSHGSAALGVTTDDAKTTLTELRDGLKNQQDVTDKMLNFIDQLAAQVEAVDAQNYMRVPEYALDDSVYSTQEQNNQVRVVGSKQKLAQWIDQNEFFLESVLKKTLTLDYDYHRGGVVVSAVIPDSVFYQMGLRQNDTILSVNGRIMNKGADLRSALIDLEPKTVAILRGKQRLTLNVNYVDALPTTQDVFLKITQQEFNTSLPELLSALSLKPAIDQDSVVGVQLGNVDDNSPFYGMNLKSNDVITKINGQTATQEKFASLFETAEGPVEIEYVRDGVTGTVKVGFGRE